MLAEQAAWREQNGTRAARGRGISERAAVRRVAAWVDAREAAGGGTAWAALRRARAWARTDWRTRRANASTAELIAECARGLHGTCLAC